MKLIIAGSRDLFITSEQLKDIVEKYINFSDITTIVSGNCSGIDKIGILLAKTNDLEVLLFPADWNTYGRSAGPVRNKKMAEISDCAIIIVNKENSKGSLNMYECMKKLNKTVFLHHIK
jgi:predicted Rossmann fold nucleotide-binding protein DprA/Smf involved in DNA uptake